MRAIVVTAVLAGAATAATAQTLGPQRIPPSGEMLGRNCLVCHGQSAAGEGSVPALRLLTAEQIVAAMGDFRSGKRLGTIMNRIAEGYSPDEDQRVAHYLAGLK
jgi:cytochrome subunit of sulfide dehydrogenase